MVHRGVCQGGHAGAMEKFEEATRRPWPGVRCVWLAFGGSFWFVCVCGVEESGLCVFVCVYVSQDGESLGG